jgi:2-polyprenyl-3-methyl-5-hydroxy-6-metoxy-1,4-benzoquinol methylase
MEDIGFIKRTTLAAAESFLFSSARSVWQENQKSWLMPLSKFQKIHVGLYLILSDWARGLFPPTFERELAWENERRFVENCPGCTVESWYQGMARSPFGYPPHDMTYQVGNFLRLAALMHERNIAPPTRVIELACGAGWLSELLATVGYRVTGTSIAPDDITCANRRVCAVRAKGVEDGLLSFDLCAMERVHEGYTGIDCFVIHEALHHAFDWRETLRSVYAALNPGGWFFICHEPNVLHTAISYRKAKLTSTHEIGLSRHRLKGEMLKTGFSRVDILSGSFHLWVRWHWMAGQK